MAEILQGGILAGTGISNTIKHLAEIEKYNPQAARVDDSYVVNGTLPQVSNVGEEHIQTNTMQASGGYAMFITGGEQDSVSLQSCPRFYALEGTCTYNLAFKDAFIEDEDVITAPGQLATHIQSIKAGFILPQIDIGAGVIDGGLEVICEASTAHAEASRYLDDDYGSLKTELDDAWVETERPADLAWNNQPDNLAALRLRAAASELTLAVSQSVALHAGTKGYLMCSSVQRRLCEAMFVAIVTPVSKRLRKEIAAWEEN